MINTNTFIILGSIFVSISGVLFYYNDDLLGQLFSTLTVLSYLVALFVNFYERAKHRKSTDKINLQAFTFVDPPGYYTHPKYLQPICPSCLNNKKLISTVSKSGYCTVCKEPISEVLESGGEVFRIADN